MPTQHIKLSTKTDVSGEILSTQVLLTSAEYTSVLVVDVAGHWISLTIEGPSGAIKTVVQKEGKLVEGKRLFKSASISKDGVISAIGPSIAIHPMKALFKRLTEVDTHDRLVSRQINEGAQTVHPTLTQPTTPTLLVSLPTFGKPLVVLPTLHPTPSILLVVPSATSPALLTSMSVTSSTTNTSITQLALLGQTAPNVLIIGAVLHHSGEDGGRSVVYTCEVTIPEKGIGLSALLGSSARTEEYLSISDSGSGSKQVNGTAETSGEKEVSEIITLLDKRDANAASTRLDKILAGQKEQLSDKIVKKLVNAIFGTALPGLHKEGESEGKKRGPYSPAMITSLLQKRMVNDEMVKGGVVAAALLPLEDWVSSAPLHDRIELIVIGQYLHCSSSLENNPSFGPYLTRQGNSRTIQSLHGTQHRDCPTGYLGTTFSCPYLPTGAQEGSECRRSYCRARSLGRFRRRMGISECQGHRMGYHLRWSCMLCAGFSFTITGCGKFAIHHTLELPSWKMYHLLTLLVGHYTLVSSTRLPHTALFGSSTLLPPSHPNARRPRTSTAHAGRLSSPSSASRCCSHIVKEGREGSRGEAKEECTA